MTGWPDHLPQERRAITSKAHFKSTRVLKVLVACIAILGTAVACSAGSNSEGADASTGDSTTTTGVVISREDSDDSIPEPSEGDVDDGDGAEDVADEVPQGESLPGDFPAFPLPDYDSVTTVLTGQMGSGKYSGRATFTMDAYRDAPLDEMISAYNDVLVNAGFTPLDLDDEGHRIRGWSTQPLGNDDENAVDIIVRKDRPGEIEIGGAHWQSIGLG